jgi:hypothetical protein
MPGYWAVADGNGEILISADQIWKVKSARLGV